MRPGVIALCLFAALSVRADRVSDWRNDIASLVADLHRLHPRFRTCGVSPEIRAAAATLSERVPSLTDEQIAVEVQGLLALAGDGHTLLWPSGMKRLPVKLWWFDDGVYVVEGSRAGQRVTKIGGVATEDVFRGLERFISRDNEMQFRWAVPFYATVPSFLAAAGVKPVLTFEDGSTAALDAEPIDLEKLELKLIPQNAHGDTFRTEEIAPGVLYIAVNSMSGGVEEFGRNLRTRLAGFDRAILDLRLNNGGDALKADELMKTLIAFDARGGKFVTLTSRMTFSAAQTFAARIDQWTATTFVGEATGSRPNHYGNERPFELPHSGLRGSISSGWNQPITSRDERETIRPDVAVPQLASDFFAGRDPGLQAALAHLARHVEK